MSSGRGQSRRAAWMGLIVLVALLVFGATVRPASAHANLARAVPEPGASLDEPPDVIFAEFSEAVDPGFSRIDVLDSNGATVTSGASVPDPTSNTGLLVRVNDLPDGTYVVAWRTLSRIDGHLIRGSFTFGVGQPAAVIAPSPQDDSPLNSTAEPFMRWLLFGALAMLLAAPFHLVAVRAPALRDLGVRHRRDAPTEGGWLPRLLAPALVSALIAQGGLLAIQARTIAPELPVWGALGSAVRLDPWGAFWLGRMVLVIASGVLLALALAAGRRRSRGGLVLALWTGVGAAAAGALATVSLGSHAAALRDSGAAAIAADLGHLLAAAVWGGGLPLLLLTLLEIRRNVAPADRRRVYAQVAARFSALALLAVGTLTVTGAYSAWIQVQEAERLLATPYGLALMGKVGLAALLVVLGAVNLLWTRRRLSTVGGGDTQGTQTLRLVVAGETAIVALVLLATGFLTSLEPARQVVLRDPQGIVAEATAGNLNLILDVRPGRPGPNTIGLGAVGGRGPLDQTAEVELQVKYLDTDLGTSVLRPDVQPSGRGQIESDAFSLAGRWQIVAVVRRPGEFDVRAPFRFELGGTGAVGEGGGSAPDPVEAQRLWALMVAGLGLVFVVGSLPDTTWPRRLQRSVTVTGFVGMAAGFALLIQVSAAPPAAGGQTNPIPPDEASVAQGRALFEGKCVQCHGPGGLGDGPLAADLNPPPLDLTVHVPLHPDADLFRFIREGIAGTAMPSFRDQLTASQIWHAVNFLQTLPP